jgi:predicted component of type VI protein secretion system
MITFDQTLEAVQRISEHLKSVSEIEGQFKHVEANLRNLSEMLEYAHQRDFRSADEALAYIDKVLRPQLEGIITALESGTQDHFKRLSAANEHTRRLLASLELVTGESADPIS